MSTPKTKPLRISILLGNMKTFLQKTAFGWVLMVFPVLSQAQLSTAGFVRDAAPSIAKPTPDPWRFIEKKKVEAKGAGWVKFFGEVVYVAPDGIVLHGGYEGFLGEFYVDNFPKRLAEGDHIWEDDSFTAKIDGTYQYHSALSGLRTLHRLSYGMVWTPELAAALAPAPRVASPEEVAAAKKAAAKKKADGEAKALKHHQDLATKGDAYGLWQMGKRYAYGDGVDKDLEKARALFKRAVEAGQEEAKADLAAITPQ